MKSLLLVSSMFLIQNASAACDFECQQGLRNWKMYQDGCNSLNTRFKGHLVVKPKQISREEFQCEVKSVNWTVLKDQFGIERIAENAMVVVDKHGQEDWQIAPGLSQYVPIEGRSPSPFSFTTPKKSDTWPHLPGKTKIEKPVEGDDIQPFIAPILMIGLRVGGAILSTYGGAAAVTDFGQKSAKVDDARKKEYEEAKIYGMESPQYEKAKEERYAAEDNCLHCYNSKFEMYEGNGYHYAGFGLGFSEADHEPKTYDFVVSHYGLGANYEEK